MNLEAGELDTRATLQRESDKTDASGDIQRDIWITLGTYFSKLGLVISQRDITIAKGFAENVNFELKMRYREDANNATRVVIGKRIFYVNGVIHDPTPLPTWTQLFLTELEK